MDSWLVRSPSRAPGLVNSTPEWGVWVRVLARDIVLCPSVFSGKTLIKLAQCFFPPRSINRYWQIEYWEGGGEEGRG